MNDNSKASPELLKAFQDIDNYAAAELARREAQAEAQHTPGPWEAPGRDDDDYVICATVKGKRRTLAHIHDHDLLGIDAEANAALIARAPELAAENERLRALLADALKLVKQVDGKPTKRVLERLYTLEERIQKAIAAAKEAVK